MRLRFYRIASLFIAPFIASALLAACGQAPSPTVQATKPPEATATLAPAKPTATAAPTAPASKPTDTPSANNQPAAQDLTPKVRTVWNTAIGSNKMEGACAGNPILPAYGQVQITPSGDALEWKNQQTTYAFKRSAPGQWRYAGPSPLNDGTVDLLLTFKDDKNLSVVHKLVPASDPGCTHTFTYGGTFMWERP